jgi:tRNA (adenine22-N1)-methyltransferase
VLQPQSELGEVRHFLHDAGFSLKDEMMVIEDDKFYFLMKFVPGGNDEAYEGMGEEAYEFGPLLLKNKNSLLKEYLIRRKSIISDAVSDIEKALSKNSDNERLKARLIELENLDSLIDKGVRVYET